MDYFVSYVLLIIMTILTLFWIFLFLKYRNKFDSILTSIDPKQFMLPELFFIGFGAMDLFKVNLKTESGRKKQKKLLLKLRVLHKSELTTLQRLT